MSTAEIKNENGQVIGTTTVTDEPTGAATTPAPEPTKERFVDRFKKTWIWKNRGKIGAALGSIGTLGLLAMLGRGGDNDDSGDSGPDDE
jgi:hypothetical protein